MFKYNVTWPCGATWYFDRTDLDVPEFISASHSAWVPSVLTTSGSLTMRGTEARSLWVEMLRDKDYYIRRQSNE